MKKLFGTARATNTVYLKTGLDLWNRILWLRLLEQYPVFNPDPLDLIAVIGKN